MVTVRLTTLGLSLPVLAMGILGPAAWAQQPGAASVIELFTSQGCSSCPTADALLREYADRADIVALSLPVDYWDYLGWKDTLASPRFSSRQRAYAEGRGDGRVYTPQAIVNGIAHAVGSDRDQIDHALAETTSALQAMRVAVGVRGEGDSLIIEAGASPRVGTHAGGTVWLAVVQRDVAVEINRGENRGKRVTYTNVVRELSPVGVWSDKPTRIELKKSALLPNDKLRCAVLLQEGTTGPIVGAVWMATKQQ